MEEKWRYYSKARRAYTEKEREREELEEAEQREDDRGGEEGWKTTSLEGIDE